MQDKQLGRNSALLFICEFCALHKTSFIVCSFALQNYLKKLFSEIDSLSALADTMKNFLAEQSRKALIFAAKVFIGEAYENNDGYKRACSFCKSRRLG